MTLQQLRYLIEVAQSGSFNAAAHELYVSQSTLSMAIKDLESELGVSIFLRSNRGLTLTAEGTELLGYARQVVEQADLLNERFVNKTSNTRRARLAISTQHYAFAVQAFINIVNACEADAYDFTFRETRTSEIIRDVQEFRSDIGLLFLNDFNERALTRVMEDADLHFTQLFEAAPHVFVSAQHPLASKASLKLSDLEEYPRYSFEQGTTNSFHFAEEPLAALPHSRNITYSDRGTLTNLLIRGKGYTLSTGVLSSEMEQEIVAIPLETSETMRVGYIMHGERKPTDLVQRYIEELESIISGSTLVTQPRKRAE